MAFALRKAPNLSPKMSAFPYQIEAIKGIQDREYGAIFHEQGLGKTKIAIDISLYWLETDVTETIFIVTKKALIRNWEEEVRQHTHLSPRILSEDKRANAHALNAAVLVYIMNYEVCLSNMDLISMFQKTCSVGAILDESQKIKNPESKLTDCYLELSSGFVRKIIMTGTPVANRPYDIWSQIKFLDGGRALGNDFHYFKSQTDLPKGKADSIYKRKLEEIYASIRDFSIRETKKTSGIELPGKSFFNHSIPMSAKQDHIYNTYKRGLKHDVSAFHQTTAHTEEILTLLLRLVQCASNPYLVDKCYTETTNKMLKLNEIIADTVPNGKVIVWTNFIDNATWLSSELSVHSPAVVHGSLSINKRNEEIDRFKHNESCRVLIATPGAAKEGLTLTVANCAVFYDRGFSLDDYLQAQDRIHRISQKKECFVHNLISKDSIDEWVDRLLYAKYIAAQISQGDIQADNDDQLLEIDLNEMLATVLNSNQTNKED